MKEVLLLLTTSYLLHSVGSTPTRAQVFKDADRVEIDLDQPPEERWEAVTTKYKSKIVEIIKTIKKRVPEPVLKTFSLITPETIHKYVSSESKYGEDIGKEMVGIAKILGHSVADIVMINTFYELNDMTSEEEAKACTSIVADAADGTIIHGRNLDYALQPYLKNMVITVDFKKDGKTSFTGSTFAGYVGLLTGQKDKQYTISLNERYESRGTNLNWIKALDKTVAFTIRAMLSEDGINYEEAVKFMKGMKFVAPCYIIIGGTTTGQGTVLTKGRTKDGFINQIHEHYGGWYVVQTNDDHWEPPPKHDNRRTMAFKLMNDMCKAHSTIGNMYGVMKATPLCQTGHTIYTVVMSAANPGEYKTKIYSDGI